jgi:hypothetical protein
MSLLAWNYQGAGRSLESIPTNAKVIFISETKSSRINKTDLINKFKLMMLTSFQLMANLEVFSFYPEVKFK